MFFFTVPKIEKRKLKIWFPNSKVTFLAKRANRAEYHVPIRPIRAEYVLSSGYLINTAMNRGLRNFPNPLQYVYDYCFGSLTNRLRRRDFLNSERVS